MIEKKNQNIVAISSDIFGIDQFIDPPSKKKKTAGKDKYLAGMNSHG